jgi:histidinol-phosphate aminotransferase
MSGERHRYSDAPDLGSGTLVRLADYLAGALARLGVRHVFGVGGANIEDLYDAFHRTGGVVRAVVAKHEFSAATMADGYARTSGRPGVVAVTSGGGMTADRVATVHRLGLNESPFGPLPAVSSALAAMISATNRYPDLYPDALTERIAAWLGVAVDRVALGAGSVGVALQTFQAIIEPGQSIVYGWPNLDAYPLLADMSAARGIAVPLGRDGRQDLPATLRAIGPTTRIVILCNPHNPTGSLIGGRELKGFLRQVRRDVIVVLDEAYIEFADGPDVSDGLALQAEFSNLLVLRTFSRAYGLAALRVGYAVGAPGMIRLVRSRQLPFGINAFASAAVVASLGAAAELRQRIGIVRTEHRRLAARLRLGGWRVLLSQANFLWMAEPQRVQQCRRRLGDAGVSARFYPGEGVRLTIGSGPANDVAAGALSVGRSVAGASG